MTRAIARPLLIATLLVAGTGLGSDAGAAQDRGDRGGLATYRNERYGFSLSYPSGQFLAHPEASEAARMFVSYDGNARLLVGALPNFDGKSVREYRDFVLRESYPGAAVDYAPLRENWFVVSGTRNGSIFYQRVSFTCGGRVINSWAMIYPAAQKETYDRVVEQVARTYRTSDAKCE